MRSEVGVLFKTGILSALPRNHVWERSMNKDSRARLHQIIRQKGQIEDHPFEIEFLDPGVQVLDFTFG
jgi:hypothetical protein